MDNTRFAHLKYLLSSFAYSLTHFEELIVPKFPPKLSLKVDLRCSSVSVSCHDDMGLVSGLLQGKCDCIYASQSERKT